MREQETGAQIELVSWKAGEETEWRRSAKETSRLVRSRRIHRRQQKRRRRILLALHIMTLVLAAELLLSFLSGRGVFAGHGLPELVAASRSDAAAGRSDAAADRSDESVRSGSLIAYKGREIRAQLERLAEKETVYREICDNYDAYPERLLSSLCTNPELLPFVQGYLDSDGLAHGEISNEELEEGLPLFLQWDERWGYAAYGESDIALSGCAPTCLSMVVVGLTHDRSATPADVAAYAERAGYYIPGTGTSWSFMTEGGAHYGISGEELCLDENVVKNQLKSGHPIICSMRPGDFTTAGHFIVLAGVEDGEIIVHDPNSKKRSDERWSYDVLAPQIKNLWVFSLA